MKTEIKEDKISAALSVELKDMVRGVADELGVSMSEVVRYSLESDIVEIMKRRETIERFDYETQKQIITSINLLLNLAAKTEADARRLGNLIKENDVRTSDYEKLTNLVERFVGEVRQLWGRL